MFNFTVEPMSQDEIEKEIFNNLFLSNLEFFQCKIWDNSPLIQKFKMDKIKEVDQVDIMVRDPK
jgi:hypothetical protein